MFLYSKTIFIVLTATAFQHWFHHCHCHYYYHHNSNCYRNNYYYAAHTTSHHLETSLQSHHIRFRLFFPFHSFSANHKNVTEGEEEAYAVEKWIFVNVLQTTLGEVLNKFLKDASTVKVIIGYMVENALMYTLSIITNWGMVV